MILWWFNGEFVVSTVMWLGGDEFMVVVQNGGDGGFVMVVL